MQQIVNALGVSWLVSVLLVGTRIAALLLLTPVLHAATMPLRVRLLIVLALACVMALPFASGSSVPVHDPGVLLQLVVSEAALGAVLGLGVLMAFAGFQVAGRLLDLQIGFGLAQVFDPATRTRLPIVSATLGLLAAVFFFSIDGHHALLRGIAHSLSVFPPGHAWVHGTGPDAVLRQLGGLFTLGFALAAPVVLTLALVDCALAVVARSLPQMNMLVMGVPVKIVVGLLALSAWAAGFGGSARRLYAGIYDAWGAWFAAGGLR
jgi:flagellar biosynthetic protein FliR